ncbi:MAG: homocysteine S-methyltransferase family protein [Abditibacteriota bacterium]|nr:homocysteine S-methyltransferase family protein [Abditibacteriota bacterium]
MRDLLATLRSGRVLLADGAIGTELQKNGLVPGESPELMNIKKPDVVRSIYAAYKAAGCDTCGTNTFGGNFFKQQEYGLEDRVAEICEAAARISKEAMGEDGFVFGVMGPTGQIAFDEGGMLETEEFYKAYSVQAKALAAGGADAIHVETHMSIIEATAAVRAAKDNTNLPVICTFTYDLGARGYRTMMGATPVDASRAALEAGADVIGSNCGNGPENMIEIARILRTEFPDAFLFVKPNAGKPLLENGKTVFPETPETMAPKMRVFLDENINIIGGCCGTGPAHLAAMAKVIKG